MRGPRRRSAMLDLLDSAERLAAAAAIGAAIGLNRNAVGKPTGVKTLGLVAVGSAILVMTGVNFVEQDAKYVDAASRVIQGIVTGIGFIGGGAILRDQEGRSVEGLTTAASVWVTAALGCVCGLGEWKIAALATAVTLAMLLSGDLIERLGQKFYGKPDA